MHCIDCGEWWLADYEPTKCTCADGGSWEADKTWVESDKVSPPSCRVEAVEDQVGLDGKAN
jgi:hypothetical protein